MPPEIDMLAALDAGTTDSRKSQRLLNKLVSRDRYTACAHSFSGPAAKDAAPPGTRQPTRRGMEARTSAKERYQSLQGDGGTTCLRARPTDSLRGHTPLRVRGDRKSGIVGIEEYVAARCSYRDAVGVDT